MKKLLNSKFVKTVCNCCLAFSAFVVAYGVCIFFYGEPEYPTED